VSTLTINGSKIVNTDVLYTISTNKCPFNVFKFIIHYVGAVIKTKLGRFALKWKCLSLCDCAQVISQKQDKGHKNVLKLPACINTLACISDRKYVSTLKTNIKSFALTLFITPYLQISVQSYLASLRYHPLILGL